MSDAATNGQPLIEGRNLTVHFPAGATGIPLFNRQHNVLQAVDGVSIAIHRGETLGLVGESGSGKSTLGRALILLRPPTSGEVLFRGEPVTAARGAELRTLRRSLQIVFQDPYGSLNPRARIGDIVAEPLIVQKVGTKAERTARVRELLEMVGVSSRLVDRYPHQFSGGQRQRIAFARALAVNPEVIVCDEPISALDVSIQAQVVNLLEDLQSELGLTYLFIAHDLRIVEHISHRVAVMYLGKIVETAPAAEFYRRPAHPYTRALLRSRPTLNAVRSGDGRRATEALGGEPPSPLAPPPGCRFHTRCPFVQAERCRDEVPELRTLRQGHHVACHWAEQILDGTIEPRQEESAAPQLQLTRNGG
ncbi:MAG TPA: oligopeptide/dipeptide ABC transporter ATP-binding protein [Solirubrobacteraceae bacterium]|nr:oligopeptide/dipeptide ABC transporter ATP-binding protein [Solirubrobacteraceae bacterium]